MARHSHRLRRFLGRAFLIAAAGAAFLYWSNNVLQVDHFTLSSSRLPAAFDGFRVVLLSDLHGKTFGDGNQTLSEAVAAQEPDLIAITGDILDRFRRTPVSYAAETGAALSAIAPTYFVTGNHDWAAADSMRDLKSLLTEHGVTVLSGEYVTLEREGQSIILAGLDDPNGLADQTTGPELRAKITDEVGGDTYSILLSHRDTLADYAPWGFHLTLCGHGHGGIFRIPLLDKGLLSTERTFFPAYDGGLFELNGNSYMVSRGLGNNTVPIRAFRLFNRPHLPLVVLTQGTQ